MIDRCIQAGDKDFKNYGGRGITVCESWRKFENFLADMGERPAGMTLDRIDNDGNYEPSNCRWATPTEQNRNSRHCKLTPASASEIRRRLGDGESKARVAARFGVSAELVRLIDRGIAWREPMRPIG